MRYDLLYYEMTPTPGAQTERRGGAGPVRACLAVRTSPAAFVVPAERVVLPEKVHTGSCEGRMRRAHPLANDGLSVTLRLFFLDRHLLAFGRPAEQRVRRTLDYLAPDSLEGKEGTGSQADPDLPPGSTG
jgi:hypothetical protein